MKILVLTSKNNLTCDNTNCDYTVEFPEEHDLSLEINSKCPKCKENLLTYEDFKIFKKFINFVDFVNKWFGWLGYFMPEGDHKEKIVTTHKKLQIRDVDKSD